MDFQYSIPESGLTYSLSDHDATTATDLDVARGLKLKFDDMRLY